ncbi:glycosyltransferase family 2 protein [Methylobacterium phyllostachyos]|uniref:glycosyltransferase family 2 protein n=1 Tax=Methylobacterium phyllostachyos TaxID=582672 RepID=UPI001FCD68AE|nr:glycosyltransferase [Methylobacterium phyllostachyos]
MANPLKIAVVIASKGRPLELAQRTGLLAEQTRPPVTVVYSVTGESDLPKRSDLYPTHTVVMGPAGAARQRNRGMEVVLDACDLIAFLDDDYVPAPWCLEAMADFMARFPTVVGANGTLLADGIMTAGIELDEAIGMVRSSTPNGSADPRIEWDLTGLYGCNMVFRASSLSDIRFDEKLPLYSWQEDIDFAAQAAKHGRLVKTSAFVGVHQGVKRSRSSGLPFGYSQIANPIYLMKKGTMPWSFGLKLIAKNIASNHLKSLRPEPWVDRTGRVRGNWLAFRDLLSGRLDPENILRIKP